MNNFYTWYYGYLSAHSSRFLCSFLSVQFIVETLFQQKFFNFFFLRCRCRRRLLVACLFTLPLMYSVWNYIFRCFFFSLCLVPVYVSLFSFTVIEIFAIRERKKHFFWRAFDLISFGLVVIIFQWIHALLINVLLRGFQQDIVLFRVGTHLTLLLFLLVLWVSVRSFKEYLFHPKTVWSLIKHFYCWKNG